MDREVERLYKVAYSAHDILFTANTVFPFILFPDTITLDREKLTVVHRPFFRIAKIISVQIKDILTVEADIGPFFGSVHATSRYFVKNPLTMNFLKRTDAIKIQRLLQGYIIATQKNIKTQDVPHEELLVLLDDLGKGSSD